MRSLPLAILGVSVALGASVALSAVHLGLLAGGLPGCSISGGCAALTKGIWGVVPGTDWPWSFVGASWFGLLLAALVAHATERLPRVAAAPLAATTTPRTLPPWIVWAARLGALASVGFLGLMVALGSLCLWCAATHAGSLVAWWAIDDGKRVASGDRPRWRSAIAGACAALAMTAALAGLQTRHRADLARTARTDEEAMAAAMRDRLNGVAPAAPSSTTPAETVNGPKAVGDAGDDRPAPSAPDGSTTPSASSTSSPGMAHASSPDRLDGRLVLGAPDAPLRIVLFTDYQCPDCYRVEQQVERVLQTRKDVAVVVKHFPLCKDCNSGMPSSMHPDACRRAALAEAAAAIGGRDAFEKAHRALFSVQPTPSLDPVDAVVRATGVDRATLEAAAKRADVEANVKADVADAIALGVTFTPMVFVNGREWKWYMVGGTLEQLVTRVAAMAESPVRPPDAAAKLVDDWRVAQLLPKLSEPTTLGRFLIDGGGGPEVRVWGDARLPGAKILWGALQKLADDGVKFRARLLQFPASEQCNPLAGFKGGDARSCLASAALVAAGEIGGDEAFRTMHAWMLEHGADVDMVEILRQADAQKLDRQRFQSMYSTSDALAKARDEADLLNRATKVTQVPTVVVDGRIIPRWSHPGADTADVLRGVIEAASAGP
ncbi:MAG: thioredoxin domain-containing protein [Phycisphaerales bacterium]